MTRDANTALARAFVDEWVRAGVQHAALAPGSRSTPLALALAADRRIRLHVHLDERSAAFFALGTAKATGRPAVVLCTSGTAAANFHPAVLEAHHARVPLVVCTADRPPELRDTGAGQTIDQLGLYGGAVRWFCEVGAPEDRPGAGNAWRAGRVPGRRGGHGAAGRARAPQPGVPGAARPDRRAVGRRTGARRRPPVDRLRGPCRRSPTRRGDRRARSSSWCAGPGAGCSSRGGARASPPRLPTASPRPPAGPCSPTRSRACGPAPTRCRPTTRSSGCRPSSPPTGPTSSCASVRRSRARSPPAGSARTSRRCSSIPTARGSTRTTRRPSVSPSTPTRCSTP